MCWFTHQTKVWSQYRRPRTSLDSKVEVGRRYFVSSSLRHVPSGKSCLQSFRDSLDSEKGVGVLVLTCSVRFRLQGTTGMIMVIRGHPSTRRWTVDHLSQSYTLVNCETKEGRRKDHSHPGSLLDSKWTSDVVVPSQSKTKGGGTTVVSGPPSTRM